MPSWQAGVYQFFEALVRAAPEAFQPLCAWYYEPLRQLGVRISFRRILPRDQRDQPRDQRDQRHAREDEDPLVQPHAWRKTKESGGLCTLLSLAVPDRQLSKCLASHPAPAPFSQPLFISFPRFLFACFLQREFLFFFPALTRLVQSPFAL